MPRTLLVDDNPENNRMLAKLFETHHVKTVSCTSGGEALDLLQSPEGANIAVVILDLAMPVLDGLTVAKEIRKNESLAPNKRAVEIFYFTGQEINHSIRRVAERTGVKQIYQKGNSDHIAQMVEAVREVIENAAG